MPFEHIEQQAMRPFEWTEERKATRQAMHWHLIYIAVLYIVVDVTNFGLMWTEDFLERAREEYESAADHGQGNMLRIIMADSIELTFNAVLAVEIVLLLFHVGMMYYDCVKKLADGVVQDDNKILRLRVLETIQLMWIVASIGRSLSPLEKDPEKRVYWYFWTSQVLISLVCVSLFVLFNCFNPLLVQPKLLWALGILLSVMAWRFHIKNESVIEVIVVISYLINIFHIGWHCKEAFNVAWANIMSPREMIIIVTFTTFATVSGLLMLVMFGDVFGSSSSKARIMLFLVLTTTILAFSIIVPRYLLWSEEASNSVSCYRSGAAMLVEEGCRSYTPIAGKTTSKREMETCKLICHQKRPNTELVQSKYRDEEDNEKSATGTDDAITYYASNTRISEGNITIGSQSSLSDQRAATSTVISSNIATSDVESAPGSTFDEGYDDTENMHHDPLC